MATIAFTGKSKKRYKFTVHPLGTEFKSVGAVYFITSRKKTKSGSYVHTRIYVGETGDLSERFDNHHKEKCFKKHGANCICIHREEDEDARLEIEQDLIDLCDPPCNG
ncbi:MAG: GIY-YIG nuclease family protein [Alphaproteobacteria bacterium]|nr:GIY-YIG nuclease family protein [Alphaproteobacteria bacterium]